MLVPQKNEIPTLWRRDFILYSYTAISASDLDEAELSSDL